MAPRRSQQQAPAEEDKKKGGTAVAVPLFGGELTGIEGLGSELDGLKDIGYSTRAEDSLIPILGILQDNSGEVKKKHDRYIEGAEAGMLIIRSLKKIFAAEGPEEGLPFQPAGFQHMWVEWQGDPGEGVPVAQFPFDDRPMDAEEVEDPQNPDRRFWQRPNGNRLVDTRYHYGAAIVGGKLTQLVVPFAGTNHTISRQWTSLMKEFYLPNGMRAPSWFRAYRLRTQFQQRGSQSWYKYLIDDLGWVVDRAARDAGRKLAESVGEGKLRADIESEAAAGGGGVPGAGGREGDDKIPI